MTLPALDPHYIRPETGPGSAYYMGAPASTLGVMAEAIPARYAAYNDALSRPWRMFANTSTEPAAGSGITPNGTPVDRLVTPVPRLALHGATATIKGMLGDIHSFALNSISVRISYVDTAGTWFDNYEAFSWAGTMWAADAGVTATDVTLGTLSLPSDVAYVAGLSVWVEGTDLSTDIGSGFAGIEIERKAASLFGPNGGTDASNLALVISTTISPATIGVGDTGAISISVSNPNRVAVYSATVLDASEAAYPRGSYNRALTGIDLAPSGVVTLAATITGVTVGSYTNTVSVSAAGTPSASASANVAVTASAQTTLNATKTYTPSSFAVGATSTVSISVTNTGPVSATGVAITCPSEAAYPQSGSWSGAMSGVTIAAGATYTVTRTVTGVTAGVYTDTAEITATNVSGLTYYAGAWLGVSDAGATTLTGVVSLSPSPLTSGGVGTLTVSVTNGGAVAATGVNIVPLGSAGLTISGQAGWSGPITGLTIAAGATYTVSMAVVGLSPGTYSKIFSVNAANAPTISMDLEYTITGVVVGTVSVISELCWKNAGPGQEFMVGHILGNDTASPAILTLLATMPPNAIEMSYTLETEPGVVSSLPALENYGSGPFSDVMTLPAGKTAYLAIKYRVSRLADVGALVGAALVVNGTAHTGYGHVVNDVIYEERGAVNPQRLSEMLDGIENAEAMCLLAGVGYDFLQEGGTLWHLIADLVARRGLPDTWARERTACCDVIPTWAKGAALA